MNKLQPPAPSSRPFVSYMSLEPFWKIGQVIDGFEKAAISSILKLDLARAGAVDLRTKISINSLINQQC